MGQLFAFALSFSPETLNTIGACVALGITLLGGAQFVRKLLPYITQMRVATTLLLTTVIGILGYGGARWHAGKAFDTNVGDYVVRAINTPDPVKAEKYLGAALDFLEKKGATSGSTSVLFNTPDCDVSEFYDGLKKAHQKAEEAISQPNAKVQFKRGQNPWNDELVNNGVVKEPARPGELPSLQAPPGIAVYPYNGENEVGFWGSLLAGLTSLGFFGWTAIRKGYIA